MIVLPAQVLYRVISHQLGHWRFRGQGGKRNWWSNTESSANRDAKTKAKANLHFVGNEICELAMLLAAYLPTKIMKI